MTTLLILLLFTSACIYIPLYFIIQDVRKRTEIKNIKEMMQAERSTRRETINYYKRELSLMKGYEEDEGYAERKQLLEECIRSEKQMLAELDLYPYSNY